MQDRRCHIAAICAVIDSFLHSRSIAPDQRARHRLGVTAWATDLRLCSVAAAECPREAAPGERSGAPSRAPRGSARHWGESASRPCNGAYMMRIASTVGPVGASMVQPALAAAWMWRAVSRGAPSLNASCNAVWHTCSARRSEPASR